MRERDGAMKMTKKTKKKRPIMLPYGYIGCVGMHT